LRSILIVIALILSSASFGQERKPTAILGYGNVPCDEWSDARSQTNAASIMSVYSMMGWVDGYVTAALIGSDVGARKFPSMGVDAVVTWLDAYCGAHASDSLALAAATFADALAAK
jgi:hypothetical protein